MRSGRIRCIRHIARVVAGEPCGGASASWIGHEGGLVEIGYGGDGFCFDNEQPRHKVFLKPFELASRLVTCGEYLDFMRDGGYERAELWLSDGLDTVRAQGWRAPLYWFEAEGEWRVFTLRGEVR